MTTKPADAACVLYGEMLRREYITANLVRKHFPEVWAECVRRAAKITFRFPAQAVIDVERNTWSVEVTIRNKTRCVAGPFAVEQWAKEAARQINTAHEKCGYVGCSYCDPDNAYFGEVL